MEQDITGGEKRSCARIKCRFSAEFQLLSRPDEWFEADVKDLSVIGVRLSINSSQGTRILQKDDIEWQDARFRFSNESEEFVLDGHFLMIYQRDGDIMTTGVEFMDVTQEQQFKLVQLYAQYRKETGQPQA